MHDKITMEMSICQAENGFSLDESVKKLADAFENKAFADIEDEFATDSRGFDIPHLQRP